MHGEVILAKSAGFCYGVQRAVDLAQKTAEETDHVWMLGDLIHNTHVVEDLSRRGIRKTQDADSISGGETVVIRSHGELKSVIDLLEGLQGSGAFRTKPCAPLHLRVRLQVGR